MNVSRTRIIQSIIVIILVVGAVSIFLRAAAPKSVETITLAEGPALIKKMAQE